jgi:tRNA-modifying protein YgfZ
MTLADKLEAARTRLAVGPVEARGVLRLTGKGARDFLHRMSTQHLAGLEPGESAYAAFLDARGHLVGEGLVVARAGDFVFLTEPAEVAALLPHLRKYVLASPVKVDDASAELGGMAVLGPGADAAARAAAGDAAVAGTPRRGPPAVEVVAPAEGLTRIREALVAAGAEPLDAEELEVLRIEEGIPRFGADMDAERLPMEAALTRDAIHFQKGCYLGQEVVLRATVRGHIQKGLVQLELPPGAGPGAALTVGDKEVGRVTSAADTPRGRLGLGYLRRAHWREGERVTTPAGDAVVRRVIVHEPG